MTRPGPAAPFELTLPQVIGWAARTHGDREFLLTGSRRDSFAAIERASAALALGMLELGIGKATRVAILMPNGPDWVTCWFAAGRIGAATVPFSTFYEPKELAFALRFNDINTILVQASFAGRDYLERLEQAVDGLRQASSPRLRLPTFPYLRRIVVWGDVDRPWAMRGPADLEAAGKGLTGTFLQNAEATVVPSDNLITISTSGSTAEPKAVLHSHDSVIGSTWQYRSYFDIRPDDRTYSEMPFFWVGGFTRNLMQAIYSGGAMIFPRSPRPADVLDALVALRATRVNLWPPQLAALKRTAEAEGRWDLSGLRSGWGPFTYPDGKVMPPGGRLAGMMGMTETFGFHSLEPNEIAPEGKAESYGRALPGMERRIVDPATGATLPANQAGELHIRGPNLMQGYYKRRREDVFQPDGFFATGDLARIDEEGFIYFMGRMGDMIKTSGANVSALEVETVLQGLPEVQEAIAFGVPDPLKGQVVVAVIVPKSISSFDAEATRQALRGEISSYKIPQRIVALRADEIPRTAAGKPKKHILRQMIEAAAAPRAEKVEPSPEREADAGPGPGTRPAKARAIVGKAT